MKLDLLAIVAHPDDAELSCGGTLAKHVALGYKVGIVDLTAGELGTRGTPEIRAQEAKDAGDILGIHHRENLGFADGWFTHNNEHLLVIVEVLRRLRPTIVLTNTLSDRHPDHGRAARIVTEACFLSGLSKIVTGDKDDMLQEAYRPEKLLYFEQYRPQTPCLVIEVGDYLEVKMRAVSAYKSQFHDPESKEPQTFISRPEYLDLVKAKSMAHANWAQIEQGEGFQMATVPALDSLFTLL